MEKLAARYGRGLYQLRINRGLSRQLRKHAKDIKLNEFLRIEMGTASLTLDTMNKSRLYYKKSSES